jgi:hypothetical protein
MLHFRHLFIHLFIFPFPPRDPGNANLGIPRIPCLLYDLHLLEPLIIVHLYRIHMLLVQPRQRLDNPSLTIPVWPPLFDRNQREIRLQSLQITRRHPSNQVGALL